MLWLAEGVGFEPTVGSYPDSGLANRTPVRLLHVLDLSGLVLTGWLSPCGGAAVCICLSPLRQLSERSIRYHGNQNHRNQRHHQHQQQQGQISHPKEEAHHGPGARDHA